MVDEAPAPTAVSDPIRALVTAVLCEVLGRPASAIVTLRLRLPNRHFQHQGPQLPPLLTGRSLELPIALLAWQLATDADFGDRWCATGAVRGDWTVEPAGPALAAKAAARHDSQGLGLLANGTGPGVVQVRSLAEAAELLARAARS